MWRVPRDEERTRGVGEGKGGDWNALWDRADCWNWAGYFGRDKQPGRQSCVCRSGSAPSGVLDSNLRVSRHGELVWDRRVPLGAAVGRRSAASSAGTSTAAEGEDVRLCGGACASSGDESRRHNSDYAMLPPCRASCSTHTTLKLRDERRECTRSLRRPRSCHEDEISFTGRRRRGCQRDHYRPGQKNTNSARSRTSSIAGRRSQIVEVRAAWSVRPGRSAQPPHCAPLSDRISL